MVPLSGLEPELLSERHFECRASTNSTRGAGLILVKRALPTRTPEVRQPE